MKIKELLEGIEVLSMSGSDELRVSGISYDSRKVQSGHIFFALKGEKSDGHCYIKNALQTGAAAVVYEHGPEEIADRSRRAEFDANVSRFPLRITEFLRDRLRKRWMRVKK